MYGYDEYSDILPEQLFQKISQEDIFSWIFKLPININEKYCAPYREDKTPRCWFEYRDGLLMFMDFGDRIGNRHKTCLGVIMAIYNANLRSAIDIICKQFGLSKSTIDYKPVEKSLYQEIEKRRAIIKPEIQDYNKKDKIYWSQYIIKVEHLEEDKVYSVSRYFLDSSKGKRWITPYSHCYDIDFIDAHKIYQPYKPPNYRWITNCDEDHIGNIDNLPISGDLLIIQKSYKDHRTLRNLDSSYNVIWLQNEGCVPSIHILQNLTTRFKNIIIFFDNDMAGIVAGIKLSSIFNSIKPGCSKLEVLPTVDSKNISDLVKKEGRNDTLKILNKIKL